MDQPQLALSPAQALVQIGHQLRPVRAASVHSDRNIHRLRAHLCPTAPDPAPYRSGYNPSLSAYLLHASGICGIVSGKLGPRTPSSIRASPPTSTLGGPGNGVIAAPYTLRNISSKVKCALQESTPATTRLRV